MKYEVIEYLEFDGSQHIDTGFKHNQDTRFICDVYINNPSAWQWIFGSCGNISDNPALFLVEIKNNLQITTYYGPKSSHTFAINAAGRHLIDLNKNVHTIDNVTYTWATRNFQSIYNDIFLGGSSYTGVYQNHAKGKVYYFQIYDNGTLIRDYIPVKVDNVGYMYDKISGRLFGNAGTGSFTLGPSIGKYVGNDGLPKISKLRRNIIM